MTKTADTSSLNRLGCHGPFQCKDCGASYPSKPRRIGHYRTVVVAKSNNEIPSLTPDPLDPIDPPRSGDRHQTGQEGVLSASAPAAAEAVHVVPHCNEAEKDEAKAERRKSLDESRELKTGEVHNKGRQVHNNFKSMSRVA